MYEVRQMTCKKPGYFFCHPVYRNNHTVLIWYNRNLRSRHDLGEHKRSHSDISLWVWQETKYIFSKHLTVIVLVVFVLKWGGKNAFTPTFSLQPWHKQIPGRQIPEAPHALSLHWSRKIPFGPSFPESSVSQNFLPVSSCCRDTRQWRNETGGKRNDEVTQILLADGRTGKLKINPYRTGSLYKQSSE